MSNSNNKYIHYWLHLINEWLCLLMQKNEKQTWETFTLPWVTYTQLKLSFRTLSDGPLNGAIGLHIHTSQNIANVLIKKHNTHWSLGCCYTILLIFGMVYTPLSDFRCKQFVCFSHHWRHEELFPVYFLTLDPLML